MTAGLSKGDFLVYDLSYGTSGIFAAFAMVPCWCIIALNRRFGWEGRPRLCVPNHGHDQGWNLEAVVCTRDLRDE
jgi:hypothetical protein